MIVNPECKAKWDQEVQDRAKYTLEQIELARIWMNDAGRKIAEQTDKAQWLAACERWASPAAIEFLKAVANGATVEYFHDGRGGVRKESWYRLQNITYNQYPFLWESPSKYRIITPERQKFYDRCDSLERVREARKIQCPKCHGQGQYGTGQFHKVMVDDNSPYDDTWYPLREEEQEIMEYCGWCNHSGKVLPEVAVACQKKEDDWERDRQEYLRRERRAQRFG